MPIHYSQAQWAKIQNVLDDILDLPAEARLEAISTFCGDDTALYHHIHELISTEESRFSFLDQPAIALAHSMADKSNKVIRESRSADLSQTHIGPYLLCDLLGRGGMGLVYRAERNDGQFNQQVAIKIVSERESGGVAIDRFRQEQQLLASLDHPNIAQLHDGGFTADGHAYIVMEYVDGVSIDRYCRDQRLSVNEKLTLILKVIDALRYAHEQLIVHRDIKPSNILVTKQGEPKLLDFGIAKLMGGNSSKELTMVGEQVMTPGYAAPEQFKNMPITPATDVFQCGLLLYELLTGKRVFRDKASSLEELVRMISTQEPTMASEVVSRATIFGLQENESESAAVIHEAQSTHSLNKLIKTLKGDLDAIIAKMLRNSPRDRYSSMQQVQSDLKAYFEHRPVLARKNTKLYHCRKLIQRRWPVLLASSLFILITLAYAITADYQSKKINTMLIEVKKQKNMAEEVSSFIVNIFSEADPNVSGYDKLTVQELLENGERRIGEDLESSPEIKLRMLYLMGDIYFSQNNIDKAIALLVSALDKKTEYGLQTRLKLKIFKRLGEAYFKKSKHLEAGFYFEEYEREYKLMITSGRTLQVEDKNEYARLMTSYSMLKFHQNKAGEAVQMLEDALQILKTWKSGESASLSVVLNNLSFIYFRQNDFSRAIEVTKKSIKIWRESRGVDHTYYTIQLKNLATLLIKVENFVEAESILEKALSIQKKLLPKDHLFIAKMHEKIGFLYSRQGKLKQAEKHYRTSIKKFGVSGSESDLALTYIELGDVLQRLERFDEAQQHYEKAMEYFRDKEGSDLSMGRVIAKKASLRHVEGDLTSASVLYKKALAFMPNQGTHIGETYLGYARLLIEMGDFINAEDSLRSALKNLLNTHPASHSSIAEAEVLLGIVLQSVRKNDEGKALLDRSLQNLKSKSVKRSSHLEGWIESGQRIFSERQEAHFR